MKPLTKAMLETLMDCHEREIQGLPPCSVDSTMHLKGLFERKLVYTKSYRTGNNKTIIGFYLTEEGKKFLEEKK